MPGSHTTSTAPRQDVRVYRLPALPPGEQMLSIALTFTGSLHQGDYAAYH